MILMTFLLGIAITYLDSFPDLKSRKGANGVQVHNLKGASSKPAVDNSMILPSDQIKNNIQPSQKEKKQEGKKKDSKVMIQEKENIYDDKWDPNHNCSYKCKSDRLGNETPLFAGEAMCNKQYRFGMTEDGDFLVHDCESNVKQVFYSSPYNKGDKKDEKVPTIYFKLKENGVFRVISEDEQKEKTVMYEHKPKRTVYKTEQCLEKPALGCPYLHLRKTGQVVINWIDEDSKEWVDRYIDKIYPKLYPKDE